MIIRRLLTFWYKAVQTARLICGVPDYQTYLDHQRLYHPEKPVISYSDFFNERQAARYDKKHSRCC